MTEINWHTYDRTDHVLAWFLVEAFGHTTDLIDQGIDPDNIDIKVMVDGIEVDALKHFEYLNSQLRDIFNKGFERGAENEREKFRMVVEDLLEKY